MKIPCGDMLVLREWCTHYGSTLVREAANGLAKNPLNILNPNPKSPFGGFIWRIPVPVSAVSNWRKISPILGMKIPIPNSLSCHNRSGKETTNWTNPPEMAIEVFSPPGFCGFFPGALAADINKHSAAPSLRPEALPVGQVGGAPGVLHPISP